tara:strand:+ start:222 stop:539 length:318 start_codon:yes stop_codon:yes gene_type:complete
MDYMDIYAEYGAIGIVIILFVYGYVKQGKRADEQAEALDKLAIENRGQSTTITNVESILLKLLSRIDREKEQREESTSRRHEQLLAELNDLSDSCSEIKGGLGRK